MQIEPRLPDLLGQGQDLLATGGGTTGGGLDYYKQQRQVLGSYTLMRQTVEQNQLVPEAARRARARGPQARRPDRPRDAQAAARDHGQVSRAGPHHVRQSSATRMPISLQRSRTPTSDVRRLHEGPATDGHEAARRARCQTEFDEAETKLRDAESELYQFQKDNDLLAVTLEERQSMVSSNITAYTDKLNEARARRIEIAREARSDEEGGEQGRARVADPADGRQRVVRHAARAVLRRAQQVHRAREGGRRRRTPSTRCRRRRSTTSTPRCRPRPSACSPAVEEQHKAALTSEKRAARPRSTSATKEALELGPEDRRRTTS